MNLYYLISFLLMSAKFFLSKSLRIFFNLLSIRINLLYLNFFFYGENQTIYGIFLPLCHLWLFHHASHTMILLNLMPTCWRCFPFCSKLSFKMSTTVFLDHYIFWDLVKLFFFLSESDPFKSICLMYAVKYACLSTMFMVELRLYFGVLDNNYLLFIVLKDQRSSQEHNMNKIFSTKLCIKLQCSFQDSLFLIQPYPTVPNLVYMKRLQRHLGYIISSQNDPKLITLKMKKRLVLLA